MSLEIRMPQVASDMTEADVVTWLANPGDRVTKGDLLLEIETEKSTVEIEAPATGTLLEILVPAGTTDVAVDTVLALFDPQLEADTETPPPSAATPPPAPSPRSTRADPPEEADAQPLASPSVPATALARRLADQAGLDLTAVTGTGARGRITRTDVEQRLMRDTPGTHDTARPAPPRSRDAASIELTARCRVDGLLAVLERLNSIGDGSGIEPLHAVVRAAALAHREVSAGDSEESTETHAPADSGDVALLLTTQAGLSLRVVRHADQKGFAALAREMADLDANARAAQQPGPDEPGGHIAVMDLGVAEVDGVRLVSGAPRSYVLGVGATRAEPVVEEGRVVAGTTIGLTLSADRHAVTEPAAARLLAGIRRRLEQPTAMLL